MKLAESPVSAEGEVLTALGRARDFLAAGHTLRAQSVAQLRVDHGWTWVQIGEVLGITKQGAAKVYGPYADAYLRDAVRGDRVTSGKEPAAMGTAGMGTSGKDPDGKGSAGKGSARATPSAGLVPAVAGLALDVPLFSETNSAAWDAREAAALAVTCPVCGVGPGAPCVVSGVPLAHRFGAYSHGPRRSS